MGATALASPGRRDRADPVVRGMSARSDGPVLRFLNVIAGKRTKASTDRWLDCTNPATGQVFAEVPRSNGADGVAAIEAASAAFEGGPWRTMAAAERARLIRRLAALVERHGEELIELETRDVGRAISEARIAMLPNAVEALFFYAGCADKSAGETIAISSASFNYTIVEPLGVVALLIPYNAPLVILASKLGAALAAGNCVVVKPSEHAACSAMRLVELALEAGFPDGVVNIVSGLGDEVGQVLVTHPAVRKIGFTGSLAAARQIGAASLGDMKQLQFELGGKSPHILFEDADLDRAVPAAVRGVMTGAAGQTCVAGSRILVQRSIWKATVEAIVEQTAKLKVGDPMSAETDVGPLTFQRQLERVEAAVDEAVAAGAQPLLGGDRARSRFAADSPLRDGYFYEPTLFAYEDQDAALCRAEIFGPVGALIPFDDEEDAVRLANDSEFGLAAGIWTSDLARALRLVARIDAGNVWVNAYRRQHWAVPFGGFKLSGYGKDFGTDAVREFQRKKSIWIETT
jgi:acyl-CoA reductase-like NAD-dependent aldehyde dehydrogenase